jgi:hypothetical protein
MPNARSRPRRSLLLVLSRALLCAAVLSYHVTLSAQTSSGGSIGGYLRDEVGGVVTDTDVLITDTTGATHRARTNGRGYYLAANLPPGDYAVSSMHATLVTPPRWGIAVREGRNVAVDLTLRIGPTAEVVTVDADTPLLESRTAIQAVNISGDLHRSLPLSNSRTWGDFLQMAPGVVITQGRFQTAALHGSGTASGVFLVDGADVSSVLQGSTLYSQFSRETFADVQVTSNAVNASAPLGLGMVVSIATRSGTNRFEGAVNVAFQANQWNATNARGGQSSTFDGTQVDLGFGGPIVRDRAWFFATFRLARQHTGVSRSAQQLTTLKALVPGFVPFDNRWDEGAAFVKVTTQLSERHNLLASLTHDDVRLGGAQPNEAGRFRDVSVGGPGYFARLSTVWTPTMLSRVSVGFNAKQQHNRNTITDRAGVNVYQSTFSTGGRLAGSGLLATVDASPFPSIDFPVHMWTIAADGIWHRSDRSGGHELEAGVYLQPRRRNRWVTEYNSGGFQLQEVVLRRPDDPSAGVVAFHQQVFDVGRITTTDVDTRDAAVYVQDTWRPHARLTITGGVRIDAIRRFDRIFGIVTQRSTEIGPRLGVNYLVSADHRNSLQFAWNRVHENLSATGALAGNPTPGVTDRYDLNGDGSFETEFVTPGRTAIATNLVVDLDRHRQSHVDEWTAGYRRQLPARSTIGAHVVHRSYRDRSALVETNGIYVDGAFAGYRDPALNEIYRLTPNTWNWPVVTALAVEGAVEGRRLQALGSYTRSWNRMAGTWQPRDPAARLQPDAFPNRGGIGFVGGCMGIPCADSDSLTPTVTSGMWRDQLMKLAATYEGPAGIIVATSYTMQSGPWSGPVLTRLPGPDPAFGPATVTLVNGRVVSNPLATPIRFAYATRAEGQLRLDPVHTWNIRAGRRFSFGSRRLDLAVDVFNVTDNGADQTFQFGGNQQYSPFFGQGANRQFPRAAQALVRFSF